MSVPVASEPRARRAVIRVTDTGIGMSPQTLARLFEPFVQLDRSLDRSTGRLGLGLALVKGLVEPHGGEASATALAKGAQAVIHLPLAGATEGASRHDRPGGSTRRQRIFIIEDTADAAHSQCEALWFEHGRGRGRRGHGASSLWSYAPPSDLTWAAEAGFPWPSRPVRDLLGELWSETTEPPQG